MSARVVKRIMKLHGEEDVSLCPIFAEDREKIRRLPENKIVEVTIKQRRDTKGIGKVWACCTFVYEHCPESYEGFWHSVDELYEWLKMEIGWTVVVGKGQQIHRFPRHTNFRDEKDEREIEEKFINPALRALANVIGYDDAYELIQASKAWAKMRLDHIHRGIVR